MEARILIAAATIIGLDLAKNVFHAHGASETCAVVFRKTLTRSQVLPFLSEQPNCIAPRLALQVGRYAHVKFKRMRKALKKLKGNTGRVMRDLRRHIDDIPEGAGSGHCQTRVGLAAPASAAKGQRQDLRHV